MPNASNGLNQETFFSSSKSLSNAEDITQNDYADVFGTPSTLGEILPHETFNHYNNGGQQNIEYLYDKLLKEREIII